MAEIGGDLRVSRKSMTAWFNGVAFVVPNGDSGLRIRPDYGKQQGKSHAVIKAAMKMPFERV